jgi:hypothetical protein
MREQENHCGTFRPAVRLRRTPSAVPVTGELRLPSSSSGCAVPHLQRREDHWAIVDLVGKGRHIRTVPVPNWVKSAIDSWLASAGVSEGRVFKCVCRAGRTWGNGVTERVVRHVVKDCAKKAAIENLAPHDLRRTCARLCRDAGGELDQIQFLLGHVSVQTTERYLGCKQRIRGAVNDCIGIEPPRDDQAAGRVGATGSSARQLTGQPGFG